MKLKKIYMSAPGHHRIGHPSSSLIRFMAIRNFLYFLQQKLHAEMSRGILISLSLKTDRTYISPNRDQKQVTETSFL